MAKRKNVHKKKSESSTVLDACIAGITKHWENYGEDFLKTVEDSRENKGVINFGCIVDQSTADTSIEVKMRFSMTVTDKLDFSVTDAAQGRFEILDKAGQDEEEDDEEEEKGD